MPVPNQTRRIQAMFGAGFPEPPGTGRLTSFPGFYLLWLQDKSLDPPPWHMNALVEMSCQTCKHPGGADYLGRGRTKIIDIFLRKSQQKTQLKRVTGSKSQLKSRWHRGGSGRGDGFSRMRSEGFPFIIVGVWGWTSCWSCSRRTCRRRVVVASSLISLYWAAHTHCDTILSFKV